MFGLAMWGSAISAMAHEGHDHGAAPPPPAAAAPRTETHSDLFEIVAVLDPNGRLWVHLDRFPTAEPIPAATVTATVDGEPAEVTPAGAYSHVVSHPALARPGTRNLIFTVAAGEETDLLPASLEVPAPLAGMPQAGGAAPAWLAAAREPMAWLAGVVLLLIGVAIGRLAAPRPLPSHAVAAAPLEPAGTVHPLRPERVAAR
ncbi:hypothetical protein, partial [Roseomonas rosulenta]|uniref:hypothetical protein n=1 Tax=Roseomonas rosulenta TaxID=2748667 RepID=UPI0018E032BD